MRAGRKNLKRDALVGIPEPELGHVLMRVVGLRGSNLIEAENSSGENTLCLLPAKFSKTIWVKKGSYVFVDEGDRVKALEAGNKVTGTISRVLLEDQVRILRRLSSWPDFFNEIQHVSGPAREEKLGELVGSGELVDDNSGSEEDDDGLPPLEANENRTHAMSLYEKSESDSESDDDSIASESKQPHFQQRK